MGKDNRQRRAAKKRQAARGARPTTGPRTADPGADELRGLLLDVLGDMVADRSHSARAARLLCSPQSPLPSHLVRKELARLLAELVATVVRAGWRATDLAEVVLRQAGAPLVPALVPLLQAEVDRHPRERVDVGWRADIDALGPASHLQLHLPAGLQVALELARVLVVLPPITVLLPPPGRAVPGSATRTQGDSRVLARVRSLLAKAESTEFAEEAELLSSKAQELISRYALDRLLDEPAGQDGPAPTAQRIWLAAPYVLAKASLVSGVAQANRCRTVVTEALGFCTVVGEPADLAAVDLLVTSLLLQAESAMRRLGRQTDRSGTSRTRSFRQSFLVAYAGRITERLTAVTASTVQQSGQAGALVPVLRRRAEQVDAAFEAMFPQLTTKQTRIGNAQGWAAGRAAADLARLGTGAHLTAATA